MAIYHLSVKIIGRSAGRSAVAAAAYRAGEKIVNEYDGVEHDFEKKNWVEYTEIILPDNAPREYAERGILWNAVEKTEKSSDAQLAREFEIALPREMTREQHVELLREFVNEKLVSEGMIADIAIHNPPLSNDRHQPIDNNGNVTGDISCMQFQNPHAHILTTVRPMDMRGNWEKKSEIVYLCKKEGEEKGFTAQEFLIAKENGWQKQYRFCQGKNKLWLTAEEGKVQGLKRVNRTPKTAPYGKQNERVEYWNRQERIFEWRKYWEEVVNNKFAKMNSEIRIDSRSFADQGRSDEKPTLHMGVVATNLERRAEREIREGEKEEEIIRSEIGIKNLKIKAHNKMIRELQEKLNEIAQRTKSYVDKLARKLENLRAKVISNFCVREIIQSAYKKEKYNLEVQRDQYQKYVEECKRVERLNDMSIHIIRLSEKEIKECSALQFAKKKKLQQQISEEQKKIELRNEYVANLVSVYEYDLQENQVDIKKELKDMSERIEGMEEELRIIKQDSEDAINEYKEECSRVQDIEGIKEKREEIRNSVETLLQKELEKKYGVNQDDFVLAKEQTDRLLGNDNEKGKIMCEKRHKLYR